MNDKDYQSIIDDTANAAVSCFGAILKVLVNLFYIAAVAYAALWVIREANAATVAHDLTKQESWAALQLTQQRMEIQ